MIDYQQKFKSSLQNNVIILLRGELSKYQGIYMII